MKSGVTKKYREQWNFDSDPKQVLHYNLVTLTSIAKNFMLYRTLIYVLSMLYVRLTIKVKVPRGDLKEVFFTLRVWGGSYMERVIFGTLRYVFS